MSESQFLSSSIGNNGEKINGLSLSNVYIPEEVLLHILSFIDVNELLNCSLVSKYWCEIVRSFSLWARLYRTKSKRRPKLLPWYLYYGFCNKKYFRNLLMNGCGQNEYDSWQITHNGGNKFIIENPPVGVDSLPANVPDFEGHNSCFATSYRNCTKNQTIDISSDKLLSEIITRHKPHIYLSEWVAARAECGSIYILTVKLFSGDEVMVQSLHHQEEQGAGKIWHKKEMAIIDYPVPLDRITFQHLAQDTQRWTGHYGMKMAGPVVKLVFDSIQPFIEDRPVQT